MKKKIAILLVVLIALQSCKKEDIIKDSYKGTSWTAVDDVAEFIYGPTCTVTIEFLEENKCQEIEIRKTRSFGSSTKTNQGTYSIRNDSVFWNVDGHKIGGIIVGSTLSTNMGKVGGGKRVYTKDK